MLKMWLSILVVGHLAATFPISSILSVDLLIAKKFLSIEPFVYHLLSVMKIQTFIKKTQFIVFRNLEVIINNNYFILCVIYCAYSPKFDCVFKSLINFKWMYVAFQFLNIVSIFLNMLLSLLWRSSSQLRADIKPDLLFLTDST